jgi:D-tagatose-1,6-bisphosphate aldolase subunit GatZ/KbaZ
MMYLDEIISAQKKGEARGITSICSAHPWVLKAAMLETEGPLLIEATCNQVNQYGGYTGMKPADFVRYVKKLAEENEFPFENIILGGDHLGPSVWQDETAESAMEKADILIRDFAKAGFVKIHLDCSMRLSDDPEGVVDLEVSSGRTARLAGIAEMVADKDELRYVIGTEVPIPGGATEHEESVMITRVEFLQQTIGATREAFLNLDLEDAWGRIFAVVVQPGVEFGDDFVLPYQSKDAMELSNFIEMQSFIFEAHSTDYQTRQALKDLVRDHFAVLKVGPALTFAFREAVYSLAMIENELLPEDQRSDLIDVIDQVMVSNPQYWTQYYRGDPSTQYFARKFSFSDRSRYYWSNPSIKNALEKLIWNLSTHQVPLSLTSQYLPLQYGRIRNGTLSNNPSEIIIDKISETLRDYEAATNQ